ncbi:hypothetical protein ABMA27_003378 [Loxostege sticticalis]|uniref:Regulatory protein zeste n=1 Tax=Loxostege sticticalis TaxID=481309 RepID=A0ABR3HT42_LOXSC
MKRTTQSQYQSMVDFMERHGDLSKPTREPNGRLYNLQKWSELADLLNWDPTGDDRTPEKWRKVWRDLKNNTKRKAARLNRGAQRKGGGPALQDQLSAIELRVLQQRQGLSMYIISSFFWRLFEKGQSKHLSF